ncbi:MAG: DUF1501 domain-containing protein [Planctomycetota bacterium]|nr:DUF1501 domain-containing protein [Planctomycetota bacterium]
MFDEITRRSLMEKVAKTCFGVSILPYSNLLAANQVVQEKKAKAVIYLFMTGAMSQIDTFDPKPDSDVQGETGVIRTQLPSVQFGESLKGLASIADQLAVVRSMYTETGVHENAQYMMKTNYKKIATTSHPALGPWMQKLNPAPPRDIPPSVSIGQSVGPGYLGANFAPLPIGDPKLGLQNTKSPGYLSDKNFKKRMSLSRTFDKKFRMKSRQSEKVNGYDDIYRDALRLLKSDDLKAFDLKNETEKVRKAYGENAFGNGCLLARRLVQKGVRFIEVNFGGWDLHNYLFRDLPEKAETFDQATTALIKDLASRRLLDDVLVVIGTEFGRKPTINQNYGRDHHPTCFSSVLAGGGINTGQVYGQTDEDSANIEDNQVSVQDFYATIASALGLPLDKEIVSPDGRPFTIANGGEPVKELLLA